MKVALVPVMLLEFTLAFAEETAPADTYASGSDGDYCSVVTSVPRSERFDSLIVRHSERARLNPRLVKAVIATESEFRPRAVSPAGATGLMQLMPGTGSEMGVPSPALTHPEPNIRAGTAYLDSLFREARRCYGLKALRLEDAPPWIQRRVLAAYNGGPRMLYRKHWPKETRQYVRRVLRSWRSHELVLRSY